MYSFSFFLSFFLSHIWFLFSTNQNRMVHYLSVVIIIVACIHLSVVMIIVTCEHVFLSYSINLSLKLNKFFIYLYIIYTWYILVYHLHMIYSCISCTDQLLNWHKPTCYLLTEWGTEIVFCGKLAMLAQMPLQS